MIRLKHLLPIQVASFCGMFQHILAPPLEKFDTPRFDHIYRQVVAHARHGKNGSSKNSKGSGADNVLELMRVPATGGGYKTQHCAPSRWKQLCNGRRYLPKPDSTQEP